jgi:preprotein translocase subunit Sec63
VNLTEILVITGGLIVGWLAVSRVMSNNQSQELSWQQDPAASWAEILNVAEDASPEQIRAAYETRLGQLDRGKPKMLTQPEMTARATASARLDNARVESLVVANAGST